MSYHVCLILNDVLKTKSIQIVNEIVKLSAFLSDSRIFKLLQA